jgi:hypothetical protein
MLSNRGVNIKQRSVSIKHTRLDAAYRWLLRHIRPSFQNALIFQLHNAYANLKYFARYQIIALSVIKFRGPQNCLSPTGDGSVRVFLIKDIRHTLASINGLPKEEETLYIMPKRLP